MLKLVKEHFNGRLAAALAKSDRPAAAQGSGGGSARPREQRRRWCWWRRAAPDRAPGPGGGRGGGRGRSSSSSRRRPLLLAIGDGANDVAMIQAADVGVGIAGKEGRQAVNNADFAVGQFRFLGRLLLLHGTLSSYRIARLIKCGRRSSLLLSLRLDGGWRHSSSLGGLTLLVDSEGGL